MKRSDMRLDVWYSIQTWKGNFVPGRVADVGSPGGKVLVVVVTAFTDPRTVSGAAIAAAVDCWVDWNLHGRPGRRAGRPLGSVVEVLEVSTGSVGPATWDEYTAERGALRAAVLAARVAEEEAEAAALEAFAVRWDAVAHLVDVVHPGPTRESAVIPALFRPSSRGVPPHVRPSDRSFTYEDVLDVFEAWAASLLGVVPAEALDKAPAEALIAAARRAAGVES